MGIEALHAQEGTLRILVLFKPSCSLNEDTSVEVVLLVRTPAHVPQAGSDLTYRSFTEGQFGGYPPVQLLGRNAGATSLPISFLPPKERPLVESPPKVLGWLEHVVDIGDKACAVAAFFSKQLSQSILLFRDRSPTRRTYDVSFQDEIAVMEWIDPLSCIDGPSCR
jgi:hypothetical protein